MTTDRSINLSDVTHIIQGQTTAVFTKMYKGEMTEDMRIRSFSIVTATRTFDVTAPSVEVRDLWLKCLTTVLPLQIENTSSA